MKGTSQVTDSLWRNQFEFLILTLHFFHVCYAVLQGKFKKKKTTKKWTPGTSLYSDRGGEKNCHILKFRVESVPDVLINLL